MRRALIIAVLLLGIPSLINGGRITGIVRQNGKPVGKGWIITMKHIRSCKDYRTVTDRFGKYGIRIREGKLKLTIESKDKSITASYPKDITSFRKTVSYNWDVVKSDTLWTLKRR